MASLYELYMLASRHAPDSEEFKAALEWASEIYPDEKINRISMAMFSYLSNNISAALGFLQGLEDEPEAWLYFSLFYARNGDLDKSEHYAQMAAAEGNPDAAGHLEMIERFRADLDLYDKKLDEWKKYGLD